MSKHLLVCVAMCAGISSVAAGGLVIENGWQVKGQGGFSAANCILDTATGRTTAIVACEGDVGVACFDLKGQRRWTYPMTRPVTAAPAVADLNGDGLEEVVAADGIGNLVALSSEGKLLWSAQLPGSVGHASCPAVADLDGDGKPEVLAGDNAGALSCFDSAGKLLWRFFGDGSQMGPVLVADIYDSPGKEIIVTSHDRHIYALTTKGEWIWDLYRGNDLFPNSSPVLADVDGNGVPELYVGGGLHHFYRIDLVKPEIVLEENVYMHINAALDAADLDGDGKDEVVFGTKGGLLRCYGDNGFRWTQQLPKTSFQSAPLILGLTDAGRIHAARMDVLFYGISGDIQIFGADGSPVYSGEGPGLVTARPLAGDLDNDGMTEVLVTSAGNEGHHGNASMVWTELGAPYRDDPRNRVVFGGDRAHTGRAAGSKTYTPLKTPLHSSSYTTMTAASVTPVGDQRLLSGDNIWRYDVANPGGQRLALLVELTYPDGATARFARHVIGAKARVVVTFAIEKPGAYSLTRHLLDADNRVLLTEEKQSLTFEGVGSNKAYLETSVFPAIETSLASWRTTNPRSADFAAAELLQLRGTLGQLEKVEGPEFVKRMATLRESAERLRALTAAGKALAPKESFFAWPFTPWGYFDGRATLPTPDNGAMRGAMRGAERLDIALCQGEYGSLALNVTNVSRATLDVRVLCNGLEGPEKVSAAKHLEFRRAVNVPTHNRQMVADALPRLDEARLLHIPSLETEQLWITVNSTGLQAGEYVAQLRLKSVEPNLSEVIVPIHIRVHDLALPRPRPLKFCVWTMDKGSLSAGEDPALNDLVEHGVTVFLASCPKVKADENGALLGPLDYTDHDEAVRRLSPHGLILFLSPQGGIKGPAFLSEPWKKAFVAYLREWVAHLKSMGVNYEQWALYPYDEPSAPFGQTALDLVEVAKVIREADPNILIYTDPTSGTTMESVKMFTGLIDIWQPSAELLERLGPELLPVAKRVGKQVWFYDASGGAKTLSCLGLYRWRFWYAWDLGLTGVGWWVYSQHGNEDRWEGPTPSGDFFATVYDGADGPVASKRWEVAREGIQDYEYLCMLRNAIADAERRGAQQSAIQDAKRLLEELPKQVETMLHNVGRRLPLTPDSVPTYDDAARMLADARQKIVETCLRLRTP